MVAAATFQAPIAPQFRRLTWRTKIPVTALGLVGGFFVARYCFYRPVVKKHPNDSRAVPVDRSGGGI